ncbi:MAG: efflux RND transporter periplasmic adaptor subunit [Planctomycetota bacterium]
MELAFPVTGVLVELPVREGQSVAKGELIGRLRQDEFEAALKSLQGELDEARASLQALRAGERPEEILRREADLRAAEARLVNAHAEYQRFATLVTTNAVSRSDYERSQTAYLVARQEFAAAQQNLNQAVTGREEDVQAMEARVRGLEGRVVEAQIRLSDSSLRAPYDGVVARRFVEQGQNVRSGEPVVQFQDVEEIEIAVDVPENVMAAEIQLAEIVNLSAELSSAPGIEFPVRIREIAQVADPVTQTFNVRVAMQSPPDIRALPGMTARVTVAYRRASVLGERILIPVEAVSKTPSGEQTVWVIGEGDTVVPRAVKLGTATGTRVEVVDGLEPGDRIVTAGVRFLRKGMKVRDLGNALGART